MQSTIPSRQKFIVSADDFGISPVANKNILELISLDKLDRVGVMVYGNISSEEIRRLIESKVALDIHLDILHEFDKERSHGKSALTRSIEFLGKILTGKISSNEVKKDWEKQIEIFQKKFGKNPDGINSHEHVHFFPPFFKIATELKKQHSIAHIRTGNISFLRYLNLVACILHLMHKLNQKAQQEISIVSLDWIDNLDSFLENPPAGKIELVCHPERTGEFNKIEKYF